MIKFQVSTQHLSDKRVVKVFIYDSLEDMRRASKDWNGEEHNDAYAITNKYTIYKDSGMGVAGVPKVVIRLVKDYCRPEIVAHEIAHATIYLFLSDRYRLDDIDNIEYEEKFCYIYGDLFCKINRKLHDYKVWK